MLEVVDPEDDELPEDVVPVLELVVDPVPEVEEEPVEVVVELPEEVVLDCVRSTLTFGCSLAQVFK